MNQQAYGTPPPPPKKSGLPTWAWIVLGCFLIVVLGAGATCFTMAWFAKKATDKFSQWEKDPSSLAMDAAEFALKHNPDVDLVSVDRETKTFTVRDKKTGQETTVSLEDIENGKFSVTSGGQEVNIDVDSATENGGSVNITGPGGEQLQIGGGGTAATLPDWVPSYPGAEPKSAGSLATGTERSAVVTFTTADSLEAVLEHYEQALKAGGFKIDMKTTTTDTGLIIGSSEGRNINVGANRSASETAVSLTYTEKIP